MATETDLLDVKLEMITAIKEEVEDPEVVREMDEVQDIEETELEEGEIPDSPKLPLITKISSFCEIDNKKNLLGKAITSNDMNAVFAHVLLASKITKCENSDDVDERKYDPHGAIFLSLLIAAVEMVGEGFRSFIPLTHHSIQTWASYLPNSKMELEDFDNFEVLFNQNVSHAIATMQSGDFFPFFFQRYDLGFVISKPHCNPGNDDFLTISWFKTSASSVQVNTNHKLVSSYPEYSFIVPHSDLIKSRAFTEKLFRLIMNDESAPDERKASDISESGNDPATKLIEWISITLMGILNSEQDSSDLSRYICIQKSSRDEAFSSGFRRSGYWMTLKVSLQLSLISELGKQNGTITYKLVMIELLRILCDQPATHDFDIGMELLAKLARKIDKIVNNDEKRSEELILIQQHVLARANESMRKVREVLDKAWKNVIEDDSNEELIEEELEGKIEKKENLKPILPNRKILKANRRGRKRNGTWLAYSEEYLFSKNRMRNLTEYVNHRKNEFQKSRHAKAHIKSEPPKAIVKIEEESTRIFERAIRCGSQSKSASQLKDKTLDYMENAHGMMKDDPITTSRIIITALKSLMILDQIATSSFPILKEHPLLDFDVSLIIHNLVLPTREESDLAIELLSHFQTRQNEAIKSLPSLISEIQPSQNSPAVRFALKDANMQNLKKEILEQVSKEEEEMKKKLQRGIEAYRNLEKVYRDTECTCINLEYLQQHFAECPKIAAKIAMENYVISRYAYPIPMRNKWDHDAIVFEINIPAQIAALRDVLLIVSTALSPDALELSANDRRTQNYRVCRDFQPWNHRRRRFIPVYDGIATLGFLFYLGGKNMKLNKAVSPVLPESQFFVKNDAIRYCWRGNVYTPELNFYPKLPVNSLYANLESFMANWSHTPNQVLAKQSDCNPGLTLAEFIEYGSLRAGYRIQYRNIYRALSCGSLSLHCPEVFAVISQILWQVGPVNNEDKAKYIYESHADLENVPFMEEMLRLLEEVIEKYEDNWTNSFSIMAVIAVTMKILEFNSKLRQLALKLIKKCRTVLEKWMRTIENLIAESPVEKAKTIREFLINAAIAGTLTFKASPDFIPTVLENSADALHWLTCIEVIHSEVTLRNSTLEGNLIRKILLSMAEETGYMIQSRMNLIIQENYELLNTFVVIRCNDLKLKSPIWNVVQRSKTSSEPRAYSTEYQNDPQDPSLTSPVLINIITGEFLVDGNPILKLPKKIIQSEDYQRVFGSTEFSVRSIRRGEVFISTSNIKRSKYTFQLVTKKESSFDGNHSYTYPVIVEKRSYSVCELIPLKLVEKDLPFLLVQGFSHWWNCSNKTIEFRPESIESEQFQKPKYILHLNTQDLVEVSTQNIMTNIGESIHDKILNTLRIIESPKYILIWKQSGEIVTKLPRFGLSFRWQQGDLVCQEYNDMKVVGNHGYHLETLIGLKKFLILEDNFEDELLKKWKIIVPHGQLVIKKGPEDKHQQVDIDIDDENLRKPPFFIFEINKRLQILTAGQSTAAWLYLAALHGATSSPMVDPFTGLTGTEMAVTILQSGHCWSCRPYDEESLNILKFINGLSPKRNINGSGPRSKEHLQIVNSIKDLPPYACYDAYHLIVQKLFEDSNRLKFLYPKISNPVTKLDLGTESDMNFRAYWMTRCNYNSTAWIKSDFLPEVQILPESGLIEITSRFSNDDDTTLEDLQWMSIMTNEWKYGKVDELHGRITKMIYNKRDTNLEGVHPFSPDDLDPLVENTFRDYWLQLYAKALSYGISGMKSEWTLILCDLLYNKDIFVKDLIILQMVAVNHDKFPKPPEVSKFVDIKDTTFNPEKVKKVLEKFNKQPPDHCIEGKDLRAFNKRKVEWDSQVKKEVLDLVLKFGSMWEEIPGQDFNLNKLRSEHINCTNALEQIKSLCKSWKNNEKLLNFIKNVEAVLIECVQNNPGGITFEEYVADSFDSLLLQLPEINKEKFYFPIKEIPTILPCKETTSIYEEAQLDDGQLKFDNEHDIFNHFQSQLMKFKNQSQQLWERLESAAKSATSTHLMHAGLSSRIVPVKIVPMILLEEEDPLPDALEDLIGAIVVIWSYEQRAIRILQYALAGESKEINLERELESPGHENWSPKTNPEWLILELEMNLMIRQVQFDVALHMIDSSGKNSVTQLNMGEGKTSVIVPILITDLARSHENTCVRVTVLKSLYETNYKALTHTLGGLLNQKVYLFPCARDWELGKDQVDTILEMHKEIIKEQGVILTIPEYRLSWELRGYESAGKCEPLCESLMDLKKWLDDNARDILDESDEILSVKYQKVYAMGKSQKVDEFGWKVTQRLLKKVPEKLERLIQKYSTCIELGVKKINKPEMFTRCRLLNYTEQSEACYQELIEELAKDFIREEFSKLKEKSTKLLLKRLTDSTFYQKDFDKTLMESLEATEASAKKIKKLNIMVELLIHPGVLRSALNKRWRVNYGVNPKGHRRIAVPFRAKDVAHEKTEFGHPGMSIVLTQLSYYNSGLEGCHLLQCFNILKKNLENPVVEYDSWISSMPIHRRPKISYSSFNLEFPHQRNQLFDALRMNMNVIDFWLSNCVFPKEVQTYPDKITCTGWDLCTGEKRITGFSGTNDMSSLLPLYIKQKDLPELEGTNMKVREAVESNGSYHFLKSWIITSSDVLQTLSENKIRVLIDAGALMIDMSNSQVAEEWLKINQDIEAVIYFNDNDELTAKTREKVDCPFGLSPFSEKLEQCAVYLDDEHTRGTDLRFPNGTVGCVTLGGRMTRDKLVQACMRLRLLQSGRHQVFFLASREAHHQIKALIKKTSSDSQGGILWCDEPTAQNVMQWVCHNSQQYLTEGLVFWANSGVNFVKKRGAVMSFETSKAFTTFSQNIQDGPEGGKLVAHGSFLTALKNNFDAILSNLEAASDIKVQKKIKAMFSHVKSSVVTVFEKEIPNKYCFSSNLDEEQEREIEKEVEEEREVSRPRSANPCKHDLNPFVMKFMKTGLFQESLMKVTESRLKGLYLSQDFVNVTVQGKTIRPAHWIASVVETIKQRNIYLLLSPFEVNEMISEYCKKECKMKGTIHMLSPRLRGFQPILLNSPSLQLPGSLGIKSIEGEDLAKILILGGNLYFDPENAEEEMYGRVVVNGGSGLDVMTYIAQVIHLRHQHFPEKCDVFKFLHW